MKSILACAEDHDQCQDGLCISRDWLCDGEEDCNMGEDESNCCEFVFQTSILI